MSYTIENWRKAITKLLELTSTNEIRWEPSDLYPGDAWITVDASLGTKYKDKTYVVSQTRSRHYLDETDFVWQGGFNLSIYEKDGLHGYNQIATSPSITSLVALFEAAEGNLAFNRNALGDLLS